MPTTRRRVVARLACSLCLLCAALAAASVILALLNGRTLGQIFVEEGIAAIVTLTVAFSVVGALIASHRPESLRRPEGPVVTDQDRPAQRGRRVPMLYTMAGAGCAA